MNVSKTFQKKTWAVLLSEPVGYNDNVTKDIYHILIGQNGSLRSVLNYFSRVHSCPMCLRVLRFCVPYVPAYLCPFASCVPSSFHLPYMPSFFDLPYERLFFLRAFRAFIFLLALLDFICLRTWRAFIFLLAVFAFIVLRALGLSIFTCLTCLHFLRVFIFI